MKKVKIFKSKVKKGLYSLLHLMLIFSVLSSSTVYALENEPDNVNLSVHGKGTVEIVDGEGILAVHADEISSSKIETGKEVSVNVYADSDATIQELRINDEVITEAADMQQFIYHYIIPKDEVVNIDVLFKGHGVNHQEIIVETIEEEKENDSFGEAGTVQVQRVSKENTTQPLNGIFYSIYREENLDSLIENKYLVCDETGLSNQVSLEPGIYYIRQGNAGGGFTTDTQFHKAEVKLGENTLITSECLPNLPTINNIFGMRKAAVGSSATGTIVADTGIKTNFQINNPGWHKIGNDYVFCIQPHIFFNDGGSYVATTKRPWYITESLAEKMALAQYYATKYKNYGDRLARAIAQQLLWKYVLEDPTANAEIDSYGFGTDLATFYLDGTDISTTAAYKEVVKNVNSHYTKPSFNTKNYELKVGESMTLTDTNGVFERYTVDSVSGVKISKNGNKVTFTVTDDSLANKTVKIPYKFMANSNGTSIWYYGAGCENVTYPTWQICADLAVSSAQDGYITLQIAPSNGFLNLKKSSANPQISSGNDCYSLENAQYDVYTDQNCTSKVGTLTTDQNGNTNTLELTEGTYYVKEIKAPKGYALDKTIYTAVIKAEETTILSISDLPQSDPVTVLLLKIDKITGEAIPVGEGNTLEGAEFTFKFYGGEYSDNTDPATLGIIPDRTWLMSTNENGKTMLSDTYKISGDDFYYNGTKNPTLPLGTLTIEETKAPHGYLLNSKVYVVKITSQGDLDRVETYNYPIVPEEQPRGTFTLTKTAATDSNVCIEGTSFRIWNEDLNYDKMFTTDKNGKIVVDDLILGTYYYQEINASDGYLLDPTVKSFTLNYENQNVSTVYTTSEAVNEEPRGTIILTKEDAETGSAPQGDATLAGATYGIYAKEDITNAAGTKTYFKKGDLVAQRTTDSSGKMDPVTDLYLGCYYVQEIKAPTGYNFSAEQYEITLSYADQKTPIVIAEKTLKEDVMKRPFELIKISSNGDTGETKLLEGVEFTVKLKKEAKEVGWENAKTYDVLKTNEKGYAKSAALPYGTYIVKETKGIIDMDTISDFEVVIDQDSDIPIPWGIYNDGPFEAYIKMVKADKETGNVVAVKGATFKIRNLDTGEYVTQKTGIFTKITTFTTDETGMVSTPLKLPAGIYQLEEIKAPKPYVLNITPVRFTVTNQGAFEMDIDGDAIIRVTMEDISVKGQITIEKKGEVLTGYEKGNFVYETQGLAGAEYDIIAAEDIFSADNNGELLYAKNNIVEHLVTDYTGTALSSKLPLGNYMVKETKAPYGYTLNPDIQEVTLKYKDQTTALVREDISFVNERQKVELNVMKKDAENYVPLGGATFGLYSKEDIYAVGTNQPRMIVREPIVKAGTLIAEAISNENGHVVFEVDLPIGQMFEIREIEPPIGYASTDSVYEFETEYQGQEKATIEFEADFKNEITKVEISKKDLTNDDEIAGASLTVYEKDDPNNVFDSWVSGQDGMNEDGTVMPHLIKGLEVNKTYVLKEISAPYGYALASEIEFTIKDTGEVQQVEMKDSMVLGQLQFRKEGEIFNQVITGANEFGVTQSPVWNTGNIAGAEITIYAAQDITIGNQTYYTSGEMVETLISTSDVVNSKLLPVGKYYYKETKAPYGYVGNQEKHYFEIENNQSDEVQMIESSLENMRQKFDIDMTKVLEEQEIFKNPDAYQDIIFGIFAKEDILDVDDNFAIEKDAMIATSGINKDGHLVHIPDLPEGKYYLKELATNGQYVLNEQEYAFLVYYHGSDVSRYTIQIGNGDINNALARGVIKIHKTDADDASKILKDVPFNLSVKNDMSEVIKTANTDDKGVAMFEDLELGIYYIQEAKQVYGYELNDHIYQMVVTQDGEILEIECKNQPTEMIFSKQDATTGKELPGAKITVTDKETSHVIDEWISTDEPHIIKYLTEGREYVMSEISAPDGYELAESITFTAYSDMKVVMKDERERVTIKTSDEADVVMYIASTCLAGLAIFVILKRKNRETKEL